MNPFANFSADFRRFIRRPLSRRERSCIERLELQRKRCGRIRAYIDDPKGLLTQVLLEYLQWHQQKLTRRDAIIISPQKTTHLLRAKNLTHRRYSSIRGYCRPVSQIIIFAAHKLKRLTQAIAAVSPLLSGPDTILLIVGTLPNPSPHYYQTLEAATLQPIATITPITCIVTIAPIATTIFLPKPSAGTHPKPASTAFLHQAARHRA